MAYDTVLVDGVVNNESDSLEAIFTASEADTLIKAVTITNVTEVNAAFSIGIVPPDGDSDNLTIKYRPIIRLKSDLAPELLNHVVPAGGSIMASSTAAGSLVFRVTGRVLEE